MTCSCCLIYPPGATCAASAAAPDDPAPHSDKAKTETSAAAGKDVEEEEVAYGTWVGAVTEGQTPSPRYQHSCNVVGRRLVVFGGVYTLNPKP